VYLFVYSAKRNIQGCDLWPTFKIGLQWMTVTISTVFAADHDSNIIMIDISYTYMYDIYISYIVIPVVLNISSLL